MTNSSIYSAFQRMWQHIVNKFATKDDLDSISSELATRNILGNDANNALTTGIYCADLATANMPVPTSSTAILFTFARTPSIVYQTVYSDKGVAQRYGDHDSWTEWHWTAFSGDNIEYATDEKFMGRTVYKKTLPLNNLPQLEGGETVATSTLSLLENNCIIVDNEVFIRSSSSEVVHKLPKINEAGEAVMFTTQSTNPNELLFVNKELGRFSGSIVLKYIKNG